MTFDAYKLIQMSQSHCPKCHGPITGLISLNTEQPGFGICWACQWVGHFGVGPVERGADEEAQQPNETNS